MDWGVVAFRVVHIVSAVTWAGGVALFFFYIEPTMNKLGPDAEKFVDEILNKRKLPIYMAIASTLTVLGGALLWYHDASTISGWASSATGTVFSVGAIAAIIAWLSGNALIPRTVRQVQGIVGEMKAAGGPPSAELVGRLHATQGRLRQIGAFDLVLLVVAVLAMATARYWV
jgi:uncharacterized membrane protein